MIRRPATCLLVAALGLAAPAAAQTPLTLTEAIARARAQNPDAGSSAAAEREAAQRVTQARAGYLPKVDVAESWQRGNQPVFVFSSLLAQRQFTAADFALGALNHPDAVDNFRSAVTVEQSLFDGATRANVAAAGIGHEMATAARTMVDHDLAASVTERLRTRAGRGGRTASLPPRPPRRRARIASWPATGATRGSSPMPTSCRLDVYVSRTREQQIRAASDERIARAQLNQLMGEPLGEVFAARSLLPRPRSIDATDLASLEAEALKNRPDVKLAALQEQLAGASQTAARAAFLPQVSAQGGWEFNGGAWNTRASSWVVGAVARDQRVPWIRRQGAARRSARAGDAARPRTREGGDRRAARRAHRRRAARRGPRQRSGRPRGRGAGAREPAHHPRPL